MEEVYKEALSNKAREVYMSSMSKKVTSEQINDATQTRFVPEPEKKPDLPDDRPPVYALRFVPILLIMPFFLLLIKICDVYDWIRSKKD